MTAELRDLIAQLADELERITARWCWRSCPGPCTNPDCVRSRELVTAARTDALALLDAIDEMHLHYGQLTSVPELRRKPA